MDDHLLTPDGELPAPLAAVLDAARRPGGPRELAGEDAARAAFREHHRRRTSRRGHPVLSKGFAAKAALAAVGALSVVGVAAAATDNLPGALGAAAPGTATGSVPAAAAVDGPGAERAARLGLCEAAGRGAAPGQRGPATAALATLAGGPDRVGAYCAKVTAGAGPVPAGAGPDALGPAGTGLCRAWPAGRGGESGGRELSVAFAALVGAAGGIDRVDAYCAAAVPSTVAPGPRATAPPRHEPAVTPSHPVAPKATPDPGGTRPRPGSPPTAPPGRGRTGTP